MMLTETQIKKKMMKLALIVACLLIASAGCTTPRGAFNLDPGKLNLSGKPPIVGAAKAKETDQQPDSLESRSESRLTIRGQDFGYQGGKLVREFGPDSGQGGPLPTSDATASRTAYNPLPNGSPINRVAQQPSNDPYFVAPQIPGGAAPQPGPNGFGSQPYQQNPASYSAVPADAAQPNGLAYGQPAPASTVYGPSGSTLNRGVTAYQPGSVGAPYGEVPIGQSPFDRPLPPGPDGSMQLPPNFADITFMGQEGQSGQIMIGAAINSDAGITGQLTISEKNFDITRFPRSPRDLFIDGTAFRGGGQGFRLEAMPGNQVQRYLVSFTEPYLFDSQISLSTSGYFFTRNYFDWNEQRLGGRVSFGYRLTPDLSLSVGSRLESVNIFNPRNGNSDELNRSLGNNGLFVGQATLVHDTRDHPFLATEGHYFEIGYQQGFGDFDFPRGDIDYRRYFLIRERPDGSGRHTLSASSKLGMTGSNTPIFENYFAGGFSTMRGFDFRGASPVEGGIRVGGEFSWLNSIEYMFPLTADDMVRGVVFCDFGTVEKKIELKGENFRVAPGVGFRINMPFAGSGGAPLAFDFAFPLAMANTDDTRVFSFYMGVGR